MILLFIINICNSESYNITVYYDTITRESYNKK